MQVFTEFPGFENVQVYEVYKVLKVLTALESWEIVEASIFLFQVFSNLVQFQLSFDTMRPF